MLRKVSNIRPDDRVMIDGKEWLVKAADRNEPTGIYLRMYNGRKKKEVILCNEDYLEIVMPENQ